MLLDILANRIAGLGLGAVGVTVFKGQLPEKPDAAIAVIVYGASEPPERTQDGGINVVESPRVQVVVRSASHSGAETTAKLIWDSFAAINNDWVDGSWFLGVRPLQTPFLIERDANGLAIVGCNYEIRRSI